MAAIPDRFRLLRSATVLAVPLLLASPAASAFVSRFGDGAPPPARSEHFVVDSLTDSTLHLGPLEQAYTRFIEVTNTPEDRLPRSITVVIYPDEREFRKVKHIQEDESETSATRIEAFKSKALDKTLVRETAVALFYSVIGGKSVPQTGWLRDGIAYEVEARMSVMARDQSRIREKDFIRTHKPQSLAGVLGREKDAADPDKKSIARDAGGVGLLTKAQKERVRNVKELQKERHRVTVIGMADYLFRQDKGLALRTLLDDLKKGRTMDDALADAYPGRFRSLKDFYDQWLINDLGLDPAKKPWAPTEAELARATRQGKDDGFLPSRKGRQRRR